MATLFDDLAGAATVVEEDPTFELTQKEGRYFTVDAPDGTRVSQHTDIEYAIESAYQHARENGVNGSYTIARSAKWELKTMGFGVRSRNPGDVLPPSVPSPVTVTLTAPGELTVTWAESEDASGVAEYIVGRYGGADATRIPVSEPLRRSWYSLAAGTYQFEVRAVDIHGNVSAPAVSIPYIITGGSTVQWLFEQSAGQVLDLA